MRIDELDQAPTAEPNKLLGLVALLTGRNKDTGSTKGIKKSTFISLAQQLGMNVTDQNLPDLLQREPLSNVFEPPGFEGKGDWLIIKGEQSDDMPDMPVDRARDIVGKAAKSAMKRQDKI